MTITKVTFLKTFPLGQYINEKIEITVDLNDGDDVQSALALARSECETNHKKNNPHLYQEQTPKYSIPFFNTKEINEQLDTLTVRPITHFDAGEPSKKISPESEEQSLLEEIANATAETLKQWQIPALRNIKTKGAYNLRKKQLNLQ